MPKKRSGRRIDRGAPKVYPGTMKTVLGLLFALILAFASQTEAVARSEMAGAQAIELCGAGMVMLDAKGKPITSCSHCLAAQAQALAAPSLAPRPPLRQARRLPPPAARRGQPQSRPQPSARGPPSVLRAATFQSQRTA